MEERTSCGSVYRGQDPRKDMASLRSRIGLLLGFVMGQYLQWDLLV